MRAAAQKIHPAGRDRPRFQPLEESRFSRRPLVFFPFLVDPAALPPSPFLSSPSPSPSPPPSPRHATPHSHLRIPAAALPHPHSASLAIPATSLDPAPIARAPIRLSLAWVGYGLERGLLAPARVISPRAGSPLAHHAEDPVAAGAPFSLLLCARARARL